MTAVRLGAGAGKCSAPEALTVGTRGESREGARFVGVSREANMRRTPLYEEHVARGGKMVDFHGWLLPIQFRGIIEEHHHTRSKVSLFDCSHMGEFLLKGAKAMRALEGMVFNDMICLRVGRCRYSSILDTCGGIIDDVVAMKLSEDELFIATNAGPYPRVARTLYRVCGAQDLSPATAKIDVQGPLSRQALIDAGLGEVASLKYYTVCRAKWGGADIIISRAGYTGELGFELFVPNELAVPIWRRLLEDERVEPAGLGARDTLRLEMGYTLYGQDVDDSHTTLEAGMGRFIDWESDFHAKEFLVMQRQMGKYKIRTGVRSMNRQAPRQGYEVFYEGQPVGVVTSGCYGPSVGYGIGMAYVPVELSKPGVRFTAGPKDMEIEAVELPFYKHGTCRA
ncbi:MAG TPA: glycine cleavage system aminomethyltransferase GcvT [Candidatus Hydrogenedentes bacterium]|nr:glycine cleavage system aminomethyltransferase GcvT [Candidatus Hydrogenedentota bacterium]